MRKFKRILTLLGWNILVVFLLITVVDFAVRFAIRDRNYTLFRNPELFVSDRPFIVEHHARGFALQPNFTSALIRVNSNGFRGAEFPEAFQSMYKILILGESTTFGWNVGDQDTYPNQLQAYLKRAGADSVCVVNAGVPSYTSLQTLIYLKELLPQIKPHLVIVNVMWNDIWYSSLKNWFPEMLVLRHTSAWRRFLLKHSGLYVALTLRTNSGKQVDFFNKDALDFYVKNLESMVVECRKHGVEPVFMRPPFDSSSARSGGKPILGQTFFTTPFLVTLVEQYMRSARDVADKHNIHVINHRLSSDYTDRSELFGDPIHPTAAGNHLIGEDLGQFLLKHVLIKSK